MCFLIFSRNYLQTEWRSLFYYYYYLFIFIIIYLFYFISFYLFIELEQLSTHLATAPEISIQFILGVVGVCVGVLLVGTVVGLLLPYCLLRKDYARIK